MWPIQGSLCDDGHHQRRPGVELMTWSQRLISSGPKYPVRKLNPMSIIYHPPQISDSRQDYSRV